MSQTFGQLPQRNSRHPKAPPAPDGSMIIAVLMFGLSLVPRLWILGFWIFSHQIGDAFSVWIVPALGLVLAPWTTLLYTWMWAIGSDAVHGWEWLPVAVGVILDVGFLDAVRRWLR